MTEVHEKTEIEAEAATAPDPDQDKLLAHDYDGIKEYDNPLPGWWVFVFWACIGFAPLYTLYYHLGTGPLVADEYASDQRAVDEARAAEAARSPVTDELLRDLETNGTAMQAAAVLFAEKCAVCHGAQGEGIIGPNLTDDYWLHGDDPTAVHNTIVNGVPAKGMVAWGKQLPPTEIRYLAAYVGSLRGTNPPNPKAPEGEQVP